jgi:hypothetical protein
MKIVLPIIIVAMTVLLLFVGLTGAGRSSGTVGIASGSALPGLTDSGATPEQTLGSFLLRFA